MTERAPAWDDAPNQDGLLAAGLTAAYAAFALTFRGPKDRFWQRMTATGLSLGSLALAARPELRRTRIRARDVATGLGIAAGLYGVFKVGDRMARRIMPNGSREIEQMYALRTLLPTPEIAARLALIIAPAEEVFWRGFVQERLQRRLGTWPGAAAASAAYGGAHLPSGNLTLLGAAGVAGAAWGGLYAAGVPLGALVVSHIVWDVWTFLIAPTS
jgi:hypothetical protein